MAKKKNDKKAIEKNKSDVANIGNELKKVSWPKASELSKATASVVFLVVIVALIIFLSDSLFSLGLKKITEPIIEKQKKEQNIGTESTTSTTEKKSEKTEENKTEENKKEETKTEENKENKEQQ
jgi:preprotein translocase, secE subunit